MKSLQPVLKTWILSWLKQVIIEQNQSVKLLNILKEQKLEVFEVNAEFYIPPGFHFLLEISALTSSSG